MLGLSLAPITARIAGALIDGDDPPIDVTLLDPARFDRGGRWTLSRHRDGHLARFGRRRR
jgi:hypothetical protein